jgi:hypothetical protein
VKNNRLTNEDLTKLRMACDRIRSLASLENASFTHNKDQDEMIKTAIMPYMQWFNAISYSIEDVLNGKETEFYQFK